MILDPPQKNFFNMVIPVLMHIESAVLSRIAVFAASIKSCNVM